MWVTTIIIVVFYATVLLHSIPIFYESAIHYISLAGLWSPMCQSFSCNLMARYPQQGLFQQHGSQINTSLFHWLSDVFTACSKKIESVFDFAC
jgi:hypothetical protein